MPTNSRPWYQRPVALIFAALGLLCCIGIVAFGTQVVHYMKLIKSGDLDPRTGIQKQELKASISSRFANTTVTAEDLQRLVPKTAAPTLGASKAPLQIIEFLDYGCPYCRSTASVVREYMSKHATDTQLIIRDFPIVELHSAAEDAALAANCIFRTAPQRYWLYHDRLFAAQPTQQQSPEDLRRYAQELGVDLIKYDTCIRTQAPLNDIRQSITDGLAAGVQGTPTFFFNGVKISGALDYNQFELIANEARTQAKK